MNKLIVFDLDQTLVNLVQLHNEVTHRVLKTFFGIEAWLTEVEHSGRSQRDGMRDLALSKGVPADSFDSRIDEVLQEFGEDIAANMPTDISGHILPGAEELLDAVSRTGNVVALYTGDAPGVMEAVLRSTGLGRYFAYRFSGTEVERREEMIGMAVDAARAATGREFKHKDIVVIGDSIRDIECGLKFNALTVGVTTGYDDVEALTGAGADLVVNSLLKRKAILEAIGALPADQDDTK